MDALLGALERGRTRTRRRVSAVAAALAIALLSAGAWRVARGNRFACVVPNDRVGAVWSGDASDLRRQSIHRAFTASGRATAETSWERVSKVLDDYMRAWGAMYVQTCEATHIQGEQSAEVLDLRMSCLNDNLDQVRALTDAFVTADSDVVVHAVMASMDLTPVNRCADVALLKSAVPLPKEDQTLRDVQRLRRSLAGVEALRMVGRLDAALAKALALRPQVEATRYLPLRGELLERIGLIQSGQHLDSAEATLEDALFTAEAAHDDVTAARAAATLTFTVGLDRGRLKDSERWARLANAVLDRLGPGQSRLRAWAYHNRAAVLSADGDFATAIGLIEEAVTLKEGALGKDHPDVALSLDGAGWMLVQAGRAREALERVDRAISIYEKCCDPNSGFVLTAFINRAEALLALGRNGEARDSLRRAEQVLKNEPGTSLLIVADVRAGIGRLELADGKPSDALPLLQEGLAMLEHFSGYARTIAQTRFALARALELTGGDRRRARDLAVAARDVYHQQNDQENERAVAAWLAADHGHH